jgi:4'-phosphopantetheinyl transferase EntD
MLRVIRDPELFPSFVSQYTVLFDDTDPRELEAQFPGVDLCASLASAVRKRQVEFLAGRYCAREALRRCSVENPDSPIPSGRHREPQWPAEVVGAITHTHGYASVAVARSRDAKGIGLDAEVWMADDRAVELHDSIAARGEVDAIAKATSLSFSRSLTLIFSAKESIFKCLFPQVRRYFDFRDAALVSADSTRGHFEATLLVTLTPSLPAGCRFEGRFEYDDRIVRTAMVALTL